MLDAPVLAAATLAALERAELKNAIDLVKMKLLSQPLTDANTGELLPMVELLLLEIRDIARRPHLTSPMREQLIMDALKLAGYF